VIAMVSNPAVQKLKEAKRGQLRNHFQVRRMINMSKKRNAMLISLGLRGRWALRWAS